MLAQLQGQILCSVNSPADRDETKISNINLIVRDCCSFVNIHSFAYSYVVKAGSYFVKNVSSRSALGLECSLTVVFKLSSWLPRSR